MVSQSGGGGQIAAQNAGKSTLINEFAVLTWLPNPAE
jgi:GTPase Era involved in 16S rRNA processing